MGELVHIRQPRRWEHRRATRSFTQYGSHEEEEEPSPKENLLAIKAVLENKTKLEYFLRT